MFLLFNSLNSILFLFQGDTSGCITLGNVRLGLSRGDAPSVCCSSVLLSQPSAEIIVHCFQRGEVSGLSILLAFGEVLIFLGNETLILGLGRIL